MKEPLRIGIAGLGNVGRGLVKIIKNNAHELAQRAGREIVITAVSARSRQLDRGVNVSGYEWYDNALDLAVADNVDVVIELIGGSDGVAKTLCEMAIANGKHFVTANKAMLAHHGASLAAQAEDQNVALKFEAAVAGAVPIIRSIREGLSGDRITSVSGILNGTCNYILTEMEATGRGFDEVLEEAQRLGYAEADPTFDVDGIDTAHKLAILSSMAFNTIPDFDGVTVEGIRQVAGVDIKYAHDFGYRIKLLGTARMVEGHLEQRVQPCLVDLKASIASVEGSFNAVAVEMEYADRMILEGRGAGEGPTASAVMADIVDIARGNLFPVFSISASELVNTQRLDAEQHVGSFYIRMHVHDRPGVMAQISELLSDEDISIESLIQRGRGPDGGIYVVLTTHETREKGMHKAMSELAKSPFMVDPPASLRIEKV